jgi:hypothetical protein
VKSSELRKLIREEVRRVLKESTIELGNGNLRGEIDGSVTNQAKYAKALLDLLK